MKVIAQFNDRSPIEVEGVWRLIVEIRGQRYELIPQMVDSDVVAHAILRVDDLGRELVLVPHGSNSVRFGAKR